MRPIKHEALFSELGGRRTASLAAAQSSDDGRRQFQDHQSRGVIPSAPDPYYMCLTWGKHVADLQTEEYRRLYFSWEWWGWEMIWADFAGQQEAYRYFFSWLGDDLPPLPALDFVGRLVYAP